MDKEIALAFNFEEAPEDVKATGALHRDNFLRLEKAKSQLAMWTAELESARSDHAKTLKVFQEAINKWIRSERREEKVLAEKVQP
jgi:hypothetical protein